MKESKQRNRLLALVLGLSLVLGLLAYIPPLTTHAEVIASGKCGDKGSNVTWELDDTGTLTISGKGDMINFNPSPSWQNYAQDIHEVVIKDGVTSIGEHAFYLPNLTHVTIPDSVTEIGMDAFSDCINLESVTIPSGVTIINPYLFSGCTNLKSVVIPNSVETILWEAFYGCKSLESVTLPNRLTTIDLQAFAECESLTSVIIPNTVTKIGMYAFWSCSKLDLVYFKGNPPTDLGTDIFNGTHPDLTIYVPEQSIEDYKAAFSYYSKSIKPGSSLLRAPVGKSLSYDGTSQELVKAGEAIDGVLQYALGNNETTPPTYGWSSLIPVGANPKKYYVWYRVKGDNPKNNTEPVCIPVTITASYTVIFRVANGSWNDFSINDKSISFSWDGSDRPILSADYIPEVGDNPNEGFKAGSWTPIPYPDTAVTTNITYTYTYAIKESSGNFGECTWELSNDLETLTIRGNGSMEDLGPQEHTPWECAKDNIKNIVIENGVTGIGSKMFENYSNLTTVTLPNSLTSIGDNAFCNCSSLTSVTFTGATPPVFGSKVFEDHSESLKVFVPADKLNEYRTILIDSAGLDASHILGQYIVTFKVKNGSWDDGTTEDKTVTLIGKENDVFKLSATDIPAIGTKPDENRKAGSWDVTPDSVTEITSNVTYTYTYERILKEIAGLGTSVLRSPRNPEEYGDNVWSGDHVYFGKYDGTNPTRYMVLDPDSHDFGVENGSILLNSDRILYYTSFDNDGVANVEGHNPNEWAISDMKSNLNGGDFLEKEGNFTDAEKSAIAGSIKATSTNETGNSNYGYAPLNGEKVFLLDISEATTPSYGYSKADVKRSLTRKKDGPESFGWDWWMRSPNNSSNDEVICSGEQDVYDDGYIISNNAKWQMIGVSPAYNISKSSVIFSSLVNYVYKLTIKDSDLNIATTSGKNVTIYEGNNTVTVPYTITDISTSSTPNQISIVVTDGTWTDAGWSDEAAVLQYVSLEMDIETAVGNTITGTCKFTLADGITGNWGTDYHVYILAENAKSGTNLTDYASIPFELEQPLKCLLGDVNDDHIIDSKDVTLLRRYLIRVLNVTINTANADIDGNGIIDPRDVTMLRRYLAGGWGIKLN